MVLRMSFLKLQRQHVGCFTDYFQAFNNRIPEQDIFLQITQRLALHKLLSTIYMLQNMLQPT